MVVVVIAAVVCDSSPGMHSVKSNAFKGMVWGACQPQPLPPSPLHAPPEVIANGRLTGLAYCKFQ